MRKLLLSLLVFTCLHASAQKSTVTGKVIDTVEKKNLQHAVISLLNADDSTLYKFIRTDKNGSFSFNQVDTGKYLLLVTYPKFADYVDELHINGNPINLGEIPLIQKAKLLEAVVIRQQWSIRMKGDTVEYKADSFKTAEGATVKDLLKKLPGLQVDKNGQITAQGEKVERVLVDGEEFFSDDPAVVIENLRADAIDKVQSYDKKSDQAEFTGVDDGSRSKTLNLVLKDDKKKGLMGKVVVGGGTDERYSEEAMLNYFKGKKKLSVYGIASNTGRAGLGWEDRNKFGSGSDFEDAEVEMGSGFIMINGDGDQDFADWENNYYGEGVPRTLKAGAHFSNKWNEDKNRVNTNYSIKDMRNLAKGSSSYKYILPDSAYFTHEDHVSGTRSIQQMASGVYDIKFDSLSSLKVKLNGRLDRHDGNDYNETTTWDEDSSLVNVNKRNNLVDRENKAFLVSALWRQKFSKKGRTLSLSASQKINETESTGFLFSSLDYYNGGGVVKTDSIDQYKTGLSKKSTTTSKLVYTEPAGKKGLIEFNYAFQNQKSTLDRQSFDKQGGKYESLNPLFSIRYGLNYLSNSAGAKYQYNGKKFIANVGTNVGISNIKQEDANGKQIRHLRFTNLFPTGRITYKFSPQRSLSVSYAGTPQPPSVEQVQPTRENTNPLFITEGNPDLRQAFNHNMSVFFNDFKMLTGRNVWINGSFSSTQNAITTSQVIDSGKTTQQYINTSGNFNYWLYASYGFKIAKPEIYISFNLNGNGNNYSNVIDGKKNTNKNRIYGIGLYSSKYKEEKYDVSFSTEFNYNSTTSTVNKQKNNFWTQSYAFQANVYLTKRLRAGSDLDFDIRQKTEVFKGNANFTIWSANLSYQVFKKKNGTFKLEVFDLLNQRRGYTREFTSNYLYERQYNTLGQYGMLSFTWNFTKSPGQTK